MASVVGICNRALQKLGAKRIAAIDEESVNARHCNVAYEPLRDKLQRIHPWNFTIKRFLLAKDVVGPAFGPGNYYTLPAEFLRLVAQDEMYESIYRDWVIEGRKILTMFSDPLPIRLGCRVTDPTLFDPLFCEALSAFMADELCEVITQSNSKQAAMSAFYDKAMNDARRGDAIEKKPQLAVDGEWIEDRRR